MGSESLFTKCKTCDKQISKSASACPQCGAKQKKLSVIHWIGIAFLGFIIIGAINAPDNDTSAKGPNSSLPVSQRKAQSLESQMPERQSKFNQAVTEYAARYRAAKNELQQSTVRDQRKIAISTLLNGYTVTSWIGTINKLETNSDGKAILSVRISPDIELQTWNNAFSDMAFNTLIEKGSPVFSSLFDLSEGERVKFSGEFFPSESDFVKETSITIDGSMRNPEFLFKFESVTSIN